MEQKYQKRKEIPQSHQINVTNVTVIQLWRSLYSKVITLANRNVKEGLAGRKKKHTM
jgi:hypothetical protein